MLKVSDLFTLQYGHSLELNRLKQSDAPDAVNFVGRAARNNGVTARVKPITGLVPAAAGTLSVALGGQGGAGVAFLQPAPYYCGRDVMVLTPKTPMTEQERLWWATCITANRFRFGFGRQANRTLKDLLLPDAEDMPEWVHHVDFRKSFEDTLNALKQLSTSPPAAAPATIGAARARIDDIFDVKLGTNLELLRLTQQSDGVNFVSRSARNNGVTARVAPVPGVTPTPGGVLTVAGGGSVLESFVQTEPFYSGRDLFVLTPKQPMCMEEMMFYTACIRENQWRYSYGRQANRSLKSLLVPAREAIPAWVYGTFERTANALIKKLNA